MNNLKEFSNKIGDEVTAVLSRVDFEQTKAFLDLIQGARKIALYGGGREGLMIRALAMRLFHLGYDVSVVGDMTAPYLTNRDLSNGPERLLVRPGIDTPILNSSAFLRRSAKRSVEPTSAADCFSFHPAYLK